ARRLHQRVTRPLGHDLPLQQVPVEAPQPLVVRATDVEVHHRIRLTHRLFTHVGSSCDSSSSWIGSMDGNARARSSESWCSRSGTARYSRKVPTIRMVTSPCFRSTLRCSETLA